MVRFFAPSVTFCTSKDSYLKAKWIPWLFVIPILAYLLLRYFETSLTELIIPFFPVEADKSFGFYRDLLRLCFDEMLWFSFFLLSAWLLFVYASFPAVHQLERAQSGNTRTVMPFVAMVLIGTWLIAEYTLSEFPNSADEYVYLFQARTLSEGRLTQEAHPLKEFFFFNHLAQKEGVTVGRFPPGWPLLLMLPYLFNFPPMWLNPVLGAITLLLFFSFVRRYYSLPIAIGSLVAAGITGYFIFNAASFFSHTSCGLFTVAFIYCFHLYREERAGHWAWIAGACLGAIILIRYFTAVLVFLPVLVALVIDFRWKAARPLALMALGAIPFVAFLSWYNYEITGSALLPVTTWVDPTETLGFVKGHTFLKGVEHLVRRALLFMYWTSPALLVLYLVFVVRQVLGKEAKFSHPEDYFLLLLAAGYFFYHHPGGNQYGPRFLFEAFPFVVVFVVSKVARSRARWSTAILIAGVIYAAVKLPYIIQRESRVVQERLDLYAQTHENIPSRAVVFISTHTGIIRPMPPGDLTRNSSRYDDPVIYALDLGQRNVELMKFYPEREYFRYVRDPDAAEGTLVRLQP